MRKDIIIDLALCLLGLFVLSCSSQSSEKIYAPGAEITYRVEIYAQDSFIKEDSIKLVVLEVNRKLQDLAGQRSIQWIYLGMDSARVETTGVTEERDGQKVFLHPPRNHYMQFTELAPFPSINLTIGKSTSKGYTLITHSFGDWNGKTIAKYDTVQTQETVIIGTKSFDDCWIQKGASLETPLGPIRTKFFFHEKYGFIQMEYRVVDEQKKIVLSAQKLRGFPTDAE